MKTVKILMSNPPWWEGKEGPVLRRRWRAGVRAGSRWPFTQPVTSKPDRFMPGDYLPYPMFMGFAATYLAKQTGLDVTLRDSIALRESLKSYYRHLSDVRYDYVFIETATPSWDNDRAIILAIRKLLPDARIVVTGPMTATKSEEILAEYPVHACIKGEYEKGSVRVVNGESGIIGFDMLSPSEMNEAPFPYFDITSAAHYWDGLPVGQQHPQAQVWSSRGCPFKCIFCVWPATMTGEDPDGTGRRTVRRYSAEYVEAFLLDLKGRFPLKCVYFDDDTFNLGDSHVVSICEVMTRIGLPWSAMCRTDTIKRETWKAMKESGCFGVKLGFESGNQWVVDNIVRKNLDLEQAKEVVFELKRLGMTVHGTFTYGLPGETAEHMRDTKAFIESLPFDSIQESGCAVIEGTPLHTLTTGKRLEKYSGAVIEDGYGVQSDGMRRLEDFSQTRRGPGIIKDSQSRRT
jgi:radical SAM superfamily enzyme YgiQ (UPF0313 family)